MKRLLLLAVAVAAAALVLTGAASGQIAAGRGFPDRIIASATPGTDTTRPYTFTTRGQVVFPSRVCDLGFAPSEPGPDNCVPTKCPGGECVPPTQSEVCNGKATVRYKLGSRTISERLVAVRSDCRFVSSVRFGDRKGKLEGRGLKVDVRYQGNQFLNPRRAPKFFVRAGRR